jgi:hypothetical protein
MGRLDMPALNRGFASLTAQSRRHVGNRWSLYDIRHSYPKVRKNRKWVRSVYDWMSSDFEIEPGLSFGEFLRAQIEDAAFIERNGFMPERAERVAERLQAHVPEQDRVEVLVPWMRMRTAFTVPGKYVYFSRGLLERCPNDETAAFVIAHEIAHHELGHLELFRGPFTKHAAKLGAGQLLVLFFRFLQKRIYSPEWECAADRRAIELCIKAGYEATRCIYLFHILELILLDAGDLDGVYGPDPESDEELFPDADFMTKARVWMWQRKRGYLPLQDRAAALRLHLSALTPNSGAA